MFGVMKQRFAILQHAPRYSYRKQVKLVVAMCVFTNFFQCAGGEDALHAEWDAEHEDDPAPARPYRPGAQAVSATRERNAAVALRDRIAEDMWRDYQAILAERGAASALEDV